MPNCWQLLKLKNPHDLIKSNYRVLHFLFLCESNDWLSAVTELETKAPTVAGPSGEISGGKGGRRVDAQYNWLCLSLSPSPATLQHPTDRNGGENNGSCDGIAPVFISVGKLILRAPDWVVTALWSDSQTERDSDGVRVTAWHCLRLTIYTALAALHWRWVSDHQLALNLSE